MTNATKALLIAFINAVLPLLTSFGLDLSDAQIVAIQGVVNAGLALVVALTYKQSPKRIPE